MTMLKYTLGPQEVAGLTGLSKEKVREYTRRGYIPCLRFAKGREYVYDRRKIISWCRFVHKLGAANAWFAPSGEGELHAWLDEANRRADEAEATIDNLSQSIALLQEKTRWLPAEEQLRILAEALRSAAERL